MKLAPWLIGMLALGGCAAKHVALTPPAGVGWRAQHQGYYQDRVDASSQTAGNYQVTTVYMSTTQHLLAAEVQTERARLVAGNVATPALLANPEVR